MNLQIQPQLPLTCMERQDAEHRTELRTRVYTAERKDIRIFNALCLELVARQKNASLIWACTLMAEYLLSMQKILDSMSRIRKRTIERLLSIIHHAIANYLSMVSVVLSQNVSRIQQDKASSHFSSPSGSDIILATSFIYTPGWKIKTQASGIRAPSLRVSNPPSFITLVTISKNSAWTH